MGVGTIYYSKTRFPESFLFSRHGLTPNWTCVVNLPVMTHFSESALASLAKDHLSLPTPVSPFNFTSRTDTCHWPRASTVIYVIFTEESCSTLLHRGASSTSSFESYWGPGASCHYWNARCLILTSDTSSFVSRYNQGRAVSTISFYPRIYESTYCYVPVGFVTCLKNGCNAVIPLAQRNRARDGGKGDGFGSLSAYRVRTRDFFIFDPKWQKLYNSHTFRNLIPHIGKSLESN